MDRFTYENQGTESMLVYRMGRDEHLDSFARGMLQSNEMEGILRPSFTQWDMDQYLKYPVTSKIPLKDFLQGEMEKESVLSLCRSIACAMQEIEEYMLSQEKLLLDMDFIFVDIRRKEASLVYLPVDEFSQAVTIKEFLLMLLSHMRYRLSQDVSYVAKLIHFLNRPDIWEFEELKRYIQELLAETDHKDCRPAGVSQKKAPVNVPGSIGGGTFGPGLPLDGQKKTEEIVRAGSVASSDAGSNFNPIAQDLSQKEAEKEESKKRGLFKKKAKKEKGADRQKTVLSVPGIPAPPANISGDRGGMPTTAMPEPEVILNVNEDGDYLADQSPVKDKKRGGLFHFGKNKKKTLSESVPPWQAPPSVPVSPPPVPISLTQPAPQPVPVSPPRPVSPVPAPSQESELSGNATYRQTQEGATVYMGHGSSNDENKTVILGGRADYGSTVILGGGDSQRGTVPKHVVKLTRRRTGQSKVINKELFRIGSEGSFVDFYIGDNPAIGACHADIFEEDGAYYISDRNSVNHTYINGTMAQPMQAVRLATGSIITLADEDFDFIIS